MNDHSIAMKMAGEAMSKAAAELNRMADVARTEVAPALDRFTRTIYDTTRRAGLRHQAKNKGRPGWRHLRANT